MGRHLLALVYFIITIGGASAKCFTSSVSRDQGLCQGTFTVKVCAGNQTAANLYVQENHGVIVRGNCKKALAIVCGDVGGGEPTEDLEGICCRVANQCETDADCGAWEDPAAVPMCCGYCEEMYGSACRSSQPVHSAFASVVALYDAFYISEVKKKCKGYAPRRREIKDETPHCWCRLYGDSGCWYLIPAWICLSHACAVPGADVVYGGTGLGGTGGARAVWHGQY